MARRASGFVTVVLLLLALAGAYWQYRQRAEAAPVAPDFRAVPAGQVLSENHFSPAENLEQLDAATLQRAQRTLDVAMYAFTDKYLAEELRDAARRGVKVRLYRDRSQYEQEQRNAREHNDACATDLLRGDPNLEIRIKADRGRAIMHLKAYLVDGALLRDGSANWSPSGLKAQDNNAHLTTDPAQVKSFARQFEMMWARPDNLVVQ
jgi:phosphatidylserine/phosphatidylglycerophosphate/cardiolipin synthase-like enzyme